MDYCLHEIPIKSPPISTSSVMSVIALIHALSILSVHLPDNKHHEIPDEFPGANYDNLFCCSFGSYKL